jgi:HSP20 family protein
MDGTFKEEYKMNGTALLRLTPRTTYPMNLFNRAIEDLFGDLARPAVAPAQAGQEAPVRPWAPPVDILETAEAFEVRAELPGVAKDDVEVNVEDNVLTLKGERKFEKDAGGGSFHRIERAYGTFSRAFTLPSRVDAATVEAKFENGLLTVVVPKAAEAKPRKINIS